VDRTRTDGKQDRYVDGESYRDNDGSDYHLIGASSGVPDLHGSRIFIQITSSELQG
jgi:hypothetical protein